MFARLLSVLLCWTFAAPAVAAPNVLVTIKPLHSLVAGVMEGVADPALLVDGGQNPHDYRLRPSDAQRLKNAELIVISTRSFEAYLEKPLVSIAGNSKILELGQTPDILSSESKSEDVDPHFWLDPQNAAASVQAISAALIQLDPANAAAYRKNTFALERKLEALNASIRQRMKKIASKDASYIFYHDAYGYFERRYKLRPALYLTLNPELGLKPHKVRQVFAEAEARPIHCLVKEPGFNAPIMDRLGAATGATLKQFDPEGTRYPPGAKMYFSLLNDLADIITDCSEGKRHDADK